MLQMTYTDIAIHAKKPANNTCLVTVIDMECAAMPRSVSTTNLTDSLLLLEHLFEILNGEIIFF